MSLPTFTLDAAWKAALLERFTRYVKIDTRSSEESTTFPSSAGQWDLLRLLEREMTELGLTQIGLDEHGYLFGTIPSTLPAGRAAPVVGLLAHVDTYPGTSGTNVKPQIHTNYDGKDLALPGAPDRPIRAAENPTLARCVGHTIVTSDGTTLLGADDKAGVAAIMTLADYLRKHPEVPHGAIRVGFTPDEEIGQGTRYFDVARFGAQAAYTLDGSLLGEIENETFCADSATVTLTGFDCHPGIAKNVMINAIRAAGFIIDRLSKTHLPETTEKREPYLHPVAVTADVGKATLRFIVRAFTEAELAVREESLAALVKGAETAFPGLKGEVEFKQSYRNMKVVLDQHPEVSELALDAVKRAGIAPVLSSIRGGTDGAQLSFKGLPTPNVFAGGVNFHGIQEWVSLEWMAKSVETALHLVYLWGERPAK